MNIGFGNFTFDSGKIIIRNVLDGLLHCIISIGCLIFVPLLIATIITREKIFFIVGFVVILIIILIYVGLYIFFAIKSPDRLQTEKYQIEKQKLYMFSKNNKKIENKELVFDVGKSIANIKDEEVEEKEGA